jgi:hypothetical protein
LRMPSSSRAPAAMFEVGVDVVWASWSSSRGPDRCLQGDGAVLEAGMAS